MKNSQTHSKFFLNSSINFSSRLFLSLHVIDGIDAMHVIMNRAVAKSYYFRNVLGSIREMTDASGTIQNDYIYFAWGNQRAQNVKVSSSYEYMGREFSEDDLNFYRASYMDTSLG